MNIVDLNHLEVIAEEMEIMGGWRKYQPKPYAKAEALADATAVGFKSYTSSFTVTEAVAGLYSRSISGSYSEAKGYSG